MWKMLKVAVGRLEVPTVSCFHLFSFILSVCNGHAVLCNIVRLAVFSASR